MNGPRPASARARTALVAPLAAAMLLAALAPAPASAHGSTGDVFTGTEAIYTVAWSHDGKRFAQGTATGNISIFDGVGHSLLLTWHAHDGPINQVDFSPDGKEMVSSSGSYEDNTTERDIKIWDLPLVGEPTLKYTFTGHYDWIPTVVWSPDGRYIASASGIDDHVNITNAFGEVFFWDAVNGGPPLWKVEDLDSYPSRIAWSPDGRELATIGHLSDIWLINLTTKEKIRISPSYRDPPSVGHASHGWAIAWSPDSRYVVAGYSRDLNQDGATDTGPVIVFDTLNLDPATNLAPLVREAYVHTKPAESVAWDSSGQYIASCSGADVLGADGTFGSDGVVDIGETVIYNVTANPGKLTEVQTYRGGNTFCSSVAWRPGNLTVLSGNADGSSRLYILDQDGDGCLIWEDAAPLDPTTCVAPVPSSTPPPGGELLAVGLVGLGAVALGTGAVMMVKGRQERARQREAEEASRHRGSRRAGRGRGTANGRGGGKRGGRR